MRPLEDTLIERYPRWFGGRRGALTQPLLRRWGHWSGIDQALAFVRDNAGLQAWEFVAAAHGFLHLQQQHDAQALARIPASGPLLVIANHPSGARDAIALLGLIGQVRRDVRIIANHLLAHIAPLAPLLLPVRVFGGSADAGSLLAPMPGRIVATLVAAGTQVKRGTPLVVLEAMKMEHTLQAPADGTVKGYRAKAGDQVGDGAVLVDFEAA